MSETVEKGVTQDEVGLPSKYSCVARFFHWAIALLVFFQFLKFSDRIAEGAHFVSQGIKPYHGSIGVVILIMVSLRLIWRWYDKENLPETEKAARLYHRLLYVLLFLVPISAISLMIGKGYGLKVFGLQIVQRSEEGISWLASIGSLHSPMAILMGIMVFGHAFMALHHHFVKKDEVLKKML